MTGSPGWTPDRSARAALSCTVEAGDLELARRLASGSAEEAWQAARGGDLGAGPAVRAAVLDLDQVVERAALAAARFVVPGDDEWPARLDELALGVDDERRVGGVPVGLWLRGPLELAEAVRSSVSIVGSRASTAYGEGVASDLAVGLCDAGVTVISGGAFGIDAAAHRGALAAGGSSIAVLACGVDVAYPKANSRMFDWLAADHLLVSELPPGAHPTRNRFLTRNRELGLWDAEQFQVVVNPLLQILDDLDLTLTLVRSRLQHSEVLDHRDGREIGGKLVYGLDHRTEVMADHAAVINIDCRHRAT